jgi:hypothetical protein
VRAQTTEQFADFMRRNGLSFTPVDEEERERLAPQLAAVHEASRALTAPDGATPGAPGSADPPFSALRFYRVPWLQAQELVRSRRVLLRGGLAYVPSDRLHSLVLGRFRAAVRGQCHGVHRAPRSPSTRGSPGSCRALAPTRPSPTRPSLTLALALALSLFSYRSCRADSSPRFARCRPCCATSAWRPC